MKLISNSLCIFYSTPPKKKIANYSFTIHPHLGATYRCKIISLLGAAAQYYNKKHLPNMKSNTLQIKMLIDHPHSKKVAYLDFIRHKLRVVMDKKLYKGVRYSLHLPCRGQRTHTNSKTIRRSRYLFES